MGEAENAESKEMEGQAAIFNELLVAFTWWEREDHLRG